MKSILDNLYYGNNIPNDQKIIRGSEYDKTAKELLDIEDQLSKLLESQRDLLQKYTDKFTNLLSITACEMWKHGFKFGLRVGVESMDGNAREIQVIQTDEH